MRRRWNSIESLPSLQDRTVLVTGGAGFIGGALLAAIQKENDVRVLDHFSTTSPQSIPDGITVYDGDIRDTDLVSAAMADVDIVFHLAARVSVPESVRDPRRTHSVNITGTVNVLQQARANDARVVFASSAAVYGDRSNIPIDEDAPTDPGSPYGISKLAADHYVRVFSDLYGLPTVVLRFFNVYGPPLEEGSGVVSIFVERALAGDTLLVDGDGEQSRDFIHIQDVVQALLLAAQTGGVGSAYNVGTGDHVTIERLASVVQELAPSDPPIEHTDPRSGDVNKSCADISRAVDKLGFEPTVSLRDGLATMVHR
jgi:UDP-glucose 4-epimerase